MSNCTVQIGVTLKITLTLFECVDPPVTPKVPIDLSSQTSMDIILLGPGAVRVVKVAVFVTDGTDGKMTAIVSAGEITVSGKWSIQGIATVAAGEVKGDVKTFRVQSNI